MQDGAEGGRGLAAADLGLDGGLAPAAAQVEQHLHRLRRRVVAVSIASSQMRRGSRWKGLAGFGWGKAAHRDLLPFDLLGEGLVRRLALALAVPPAARVLAEVVHRLADQRHNIAVVEAFAEGEVHRLDGGGGAEDLHEDHPEHPRCRAPAAAG